MESWTLPLKQWKLVRDVFVDVVDDVDDAGREEGVLLKSVVATVQAQLGNHPAFPGGRLTNFTRYIKVDLVSRGVLEVVPGASPQRVRRHS